MYDFFKPGKTILIIPRNAGKKTKGGGKENREIWKYEIMWKK